MSDTDRLITPKVYHLHFQTEHHCPHCNYLYDDDWHWYEVVQWLNNKGGLAFTIKCVNCKQHYRVNYSFLQPTIDYFFQVLVTNKTMQPGFNLASHAKRLGQESSK